LNVLRTRALQVLLDYIVTRTHPTEKKKKKKYSVPYY
jgi:hypothetical protein